MKVINDIISDFFAYCEWQEVNEEQTYRLADHKQHVPPPSPLSSCLPFFLLVRMFFSSLQLHEIRSGTHFA